MKYLGIPVLLLLSTVASAQKPEWPSILDLLLEGLDQTDTSKLNNSFNRCAAIYMSLERITKLDNPELGERFAGLTELLYTASAVASLKVATDRGNTAPDMDALTERNLNAIQTYAELYNGWFDSNYIAMGSYFEKDLDASTEIEACGQAASYAQNFIQENISVLENL